MSPQSIKKSIRKKKAQVAIEFIITISTVIFFVSLLLLALQNNSEERTYQKQNIQLREIALTVKNEINLASESSDGYSRNFEIPKRSGNLDYEITIDSGIVYVKTTNNKHALTVFIPEIIGNINKTQNTIRKTSGVIYLNQ